MGRAAIRSLRGSRPRPAPAKRKRTKAEALASGIGITATKLDDNDFFSFSAEELGMLIESTQRLKGPRMRFSSRPSRTGETDAKLKVTRGTPSIILKRYVSSVR